MARAASPMSIPIARIARMTAVIASRISIACPRSWAKQNSPGRSGASGSSRSFDRLAGDECECFEKILANLEEQFFGAGVARQRIHAGEIDQPLGEGQDVAAQARR